MHTHEHSDNTKWLDWYNNRLPLQREAMLKAQEEVRLNLTSKCCNTCNKVFPIECFNKKTRTRASDGSKYVSFQAICKTCKSKELKEYRFKNRGNVLKKRSSRLRGAKLRKAQPKWLTKQHKKQIQDMYNLMRDCRACTGEDYHVDHIVPLRGERICGLHVPWNLQVLPASINMSKSNKFDSECFT